MRHLSESGPGGKCRHGFPIAFRNSDIEELHARSETTPHFVELGQDVAREGHSADLRDRHLVTRGVEPAGPLVSDSRDPKTAIRLLANGGPAGGALGAGLL